MFSTFLAMLYNEYKYSLNSILIGYRLPKSLLCKPLNE